MNRFRWGPIPGGGDGLWFERLPAAGSTRAVCWRPPTLTVLLRGVRCRDRPDRRTCGKRRCENLPVPPTFGSKDELVRCLEAHFHDRQGVAHSRQRATQRGNHWRVREHGGTLADGFAAAGSSWRPLGHDQRRLEVKPSPRTIARGSLPRSPTSRKRPARPMPCAGWRQLALLYDAPRSQLEWIRSARRRNCVALAVGLAGHSDFT